MVFVKPRRPFTVWSIYSEKFKNFTRDDFNALPSEFKNNLRDCLRDLGLNIRIGSGVKIIDELIKAKEYAHNWPAGDHEEKNYGEVTPGVRWGNTTSPAPITLKRDSNPRRSLIPSPFQEF